MTITDTFKEILFNDGEEATFGDANNAQRSTLARVFDQVLTRLIPLVWNGGGQGDAQFSGEWTGPGPLSALNNGGYAYRCYAPSAGGAYPYVRQTFYPAGRQVAMNEIGIAPGTLMQIIANEDGTEAKMLAFTFPLGTKIAIAAGDGANPRVDIVQMQLQYVAGLPETRIFSSPAVKASLDLSTVTTHDNTHVQAKVPGKGGDNISIAFVKRTTGAGVTYSENGNAITILYQDGVSTVANVEAAIVASSTLIEIQTSGTGATVLHDPADTFSATVLANGADQVLVSQPSMNKGRQVQCTLSVKQGTPAASPVYPTPDAGCCVVAGVVVGTSYLTTTNIILGDDTAGANAVLHDQRMPLSVKAYRSIPRDMYYIDAEWAPSTDKKFITSVGGGVHARASCKMGGSAGRVIAVAMSGDINAGTGILLSKETLSGGGSGTSTSLANLNSKLAGGSGTQKYMVATLDTIEWNHAPAAGPTVQQDPTSGIGVPVWTNGKRCTSQPFANGNTATPNEVDAVELDINSGTNTDKIWAVTYFVAGGL